MVIEYRAYKMKLGDLHRFYQAQINRGFDGVMAPIMRDALLGYFSSVSGESENLIHLYKLKIFFKFILIYLFIFIFYILFKFLYI